MPELPEVERVRLTLKRDLVGATMTRACLRRADILTRAASPARRSGSASAALLEGQRITALERRGKQLALHAASGASLIVQLGMSGRLQLASDESLPVRHVHATWCWAGRSHEGMLYFQDPRRFGGLTACPDKNALHQHWSTLGPDALTITPRDLARTLHGARGLRRAPIKSLLLDQARIAGIGNIYAAEALFRARIAPHRSAHTLTDADCKALARSIRDVLRAAITAGGTTLSDGGYVDGAGNSGAFRPMVYGRGGQPCRRCRTTLEGFLLGARSTVWCPQCQAL